MLMVGDKLGELKNQEKNIRLIGVINIESDEEVEICLDQRGSKIGGLVFVVDKVIFW